MSKLKNIVCSVVAVCAAIAVFTPCVSYAKLKLIEIPCCKSDEDSTRVVIEGKSNIAPIVKVVGSRVKGVEELPEELRINTNDDEWKDIIMPSKNPNYTVWKKIVVSLWGQKDKQKAVKLLNASRLDEKLYILAKCSSKNNSVQIPVTGDAFMCPLGDSIELEQSLPTCKDPSDYPRTVIAVDEITKEQLLKQLEDLEKQDSNLNTKIEKLDLGIKSDDEKIENGKNSLQKFTSNIIGNKKK